MTARKKMPATAATTTPNTSTEADASPDQVDVLDQAATGTPVAAPDPIVSDAGALEAQAPPLTGEYTVLSPLDHDGKRYEIGGTITLTRAAHDALPAGVVGGAE